MRVSRVDLCNLLGVSSVGLTKNELLEQSSWFVFTEEEIITFSGEILTRTNTPLPNLNGAVPAEDFLKLLHKFPDEDVTVDQEGDEIKLKAGRRRAGLAVVESALPYKDVPLPGKWKRIPETLVAVLQQAARICGRDEAQPRMTEVHICPDMVESSDNFRIFRFKMETGLQETLIPAHSIDCLGALVFNKASQGDGWIHFRTPKKHVISVRCTHGGGYPNLTPMLKIPDPKMVRLPTNLKEILSRAEIMNETALGSLVRIKIKDSVLAMESSKETGWYRESRKIKYDGDPLTFEVHPKFLEEILEKTRKVSIGGNKLRMKSGGATFIVSLEVNDD